MSVSEQVRPMLAARAATDPNAARLLEIFNKANEMIERSPYKLPSFDHTENNISGKMGMPDERQPVPECDQKMLAVKAYQSKKLDRMIVTAHNS
jgi:hypothetical protein